LAICALPHHCWQLILEAGKDVPFARLTPAKELAKMTSSDASNQLIPTSFADVDLLLGTVIKLWHEREDNISDWESCTSIMALQEPEGWARTAEQLQLINTFQWHEEDRSRAHGGGDALLGAVKRSIDASNRRRVQTVDKLDDVIFTGLQESGAIETAAPLNSESPASIIDRLSVLALKIYHVAEAQGALDSGTAEEQAMQERLDTLTEQYADLGVCFDRLILGIRTGKAGLKLYRQVKLYLDSETGRMVADLD
jgi:hypothetical protein